MIPPWDMLIWQARMDDWVKQVHEYADSLQAIPESMKHEIEQYTKRIKEYNEMLEGKTYECLNEMSTSIKSTACSECGKPLTGYEPNIRYCLDHQPKESIVNVGTPGHIDHGAEDNLSKPNYSGTQHQPSDKLDKGKNRLGLVLGGFSRALWEVGNVGTVGAKKYSDNGWMEVPEGINRYTDAMMRHYLKEESGEIFDPELTELAGENIHHAACVAWNSLARLDLMLREQEIPSRV